MIHKIITVVSVVAIVLGKIVATQLSSYLGECQLFNLYIKVLTGMIRVLRVFYWLQWMPLFIQCHHMNRGKSVCAAFLDLCKSFNSLDRCILLHQLFNLGVSTAVLQWFCDHLFDT